MTTPRDMQRQRELSQDLEELTAELATQNDYAGSFYCATLRRRIANKRAEIESGMSRQQESTKVVMTSLPTIETPRPDLTLVILPNLELAFSYTTCVAFRKGADRWVISENVWSQTTGKHLNWLPGGADKSNRVPFDDFQIALKEATA